MKHVNWGSKNDSYPGIRNSPTEAFAIWKLVGGCIVVSLQILNVIKATFSVFAFCFSGPNYKNLSCFASRRKCQRAQQHFPGARHNKIQCRLSTTMFVEGWARSRNSQLISTHYLYKRFHYYRRTASVKSLNDSSEKWFNILMTSFIGSQALLVHSHF